VHYAGKLNEEDPGVKKYSIQMIDYFDQKGYKCVVFKEF
jgi:hypothetical protein